MNVNGSNVPHVEFDLHGERGEFFVSFYFQSKLKGDHASIHTKACLAQIRIQICGSLFHDRQDHLQNAV